MAAVLSGHVAPDGQIDGLALLAAAWAAAQACFIRAGIGTDVKHASSLARG